MALKSSKPKPKIMGKKSTTPLKSKLKTAAKVGLGVAAVGAAAFGAKKLISAYRKGKKRSIVARLKRSLRIKKLKIANLKASRKLDALESRGF